MLALFIPWLLLVLLYVIVILLFKQKWKTAIVGGIIVIAINNWSECIPYRICSIDRGCGNSLKVFVFNAEGSGEDTRIKGQGILDLVNETNPDVVFISEFFGRNAYYLDSLLSSIFPYSTFPQFGTPHYFYSKYPLTNSRRIRSANAFEPGVFSCDMLVGNDTIHLHGCHLASNNYDEAKHHSPVDSIRSFSNIPSTFNNVNIACEKRYENIELLIREMNKPFRTLVMGDMNDVGGSPCITVLENAGFFDSWWEGGVGYGATIHRPLPYRIDHIMHSDGLLLNRITRIDSNGISDHDGLYAEFSIE